jgi:leucyl aminopeptidase
MVDAPRFEVSTRSIADGNDDLVVVTVGADGALGPGGGDVDRLLDSALAETLARAGFGGDEGRLLAIPGAARTILAVGTGTASGPNAWREVAMRAGSASHRHRTVAAALPDDAGAAEDVVHAFVEGFLLGAYRFDGAKSSAEPRRTRTVRLVVPEADRAAARRGARRGAITGGATNLARDLTNMPASDATPEFLAERARAVAREVGLSAKVWTRAALERGGFGGILGVGRGGEHAPTMVELVHGARRRPPIAITGKGVTFDSGGLDIKRPADMLAMRSDMAGGAAALAAMRAIAELEVPIGVIAVLPFAENLPGPTAVRPGDVLRHRGGRTSEMIDTDAEGRVLVADAIAYLCEKRPAVVLDSATLTNGSGLGADLYAAMGNDRGLVAELLTAGAEAGEPGWEIPLWTRYRRLIDSPVADVKNLGDHDIDSAMMAALFLRDFVADGVPWVHLDTGSSAWAEYRTDLWPEGATGSPTRTLVRFVERRARPVDRVVSSA